MMEINNNILINYLVNWLGCQNLVTNRPIQAGHWFTMIEEVSEELS